MMKMTIDIDQNGNLSTLYTDEIDLYEIGKVKNVARASNVVFNEKTQQWDVVTCKTQKTIFSHPNRSIAIQQEIILMQPGGEFHQK